MHDIQSVKRTHSEKRRNLVENERCANTQQSQNVAFVNNAACVDLYLNCIILPTSLMLVLLQYELTHRIRTTPPRASEQTEHFQIFTLCFAPARGFDNDSPVCAWACYTSRNHRRSGEKQKDIFTSPQRQTSRVFPSRKGDTLSGTEEEILTN